MVETTSTTTVADFVTRVKQLIKNSQLQDAVKLSVEFNLTLQSSGKQLQLRDEVTFLHWWAKAYIEA